MRPMVWRVWPQSRMARPAIAMTPPMADPSPPPCRRRRTTRPRLVLGELDVDQVAVEHAGGPRRLLARRRSRAVAAALRPRGDRHASTAAGRRATAGRD